jgi:hypothetical protein
MGLTQTSTTKERWVTGLFNDPQSADRAYQSLRSRGYADRDINIIMSDDTRKKHFEAFSGAKTLEGAGAGSWWVARPVPWWERSSAALRRSCFRASGSSSPVRWLARSPARARAAQPAGSRAA